MIGLDTGFFVKFLENNKEAVRAWKEIMEGEEAAVSCLTLYELKRLSLKGMIDIKALEIIFSAVSSLCRIVWLNEQDILLMGANLSHGLGIPSVDALILAGLLKSGATTIYTTDSHLQAYQKKEVAVIRLL
jgi:predicted nucleic acid-binding protein